MKFFVDMCMHTVKRRSLKKNLTVMKIFEMSTIGSKFWHIHQLVTPLYINMNESMVNFCRSN